MTVLSQLSSDITALLNESKRRNSEIKLACELALDCLSQNASIDQFSNSVKSQILNPALIGCNTNNPRFVNLCIPIIQKLIISSSINPQDLSKLLKSLHEASHLAIDIQLKILQCLPSLMQIYNSYIVKDLLLNLLAICSSLTSNNKSTVVINTASATLQQVFNYTYERIPVTVDKEITTVTIEGKSFGLDELSYEGYMIFADLCKMIDNDAPEYMKKVTIKLPAILEIIENVLHNRLLFGSHEELNYLIRVKLIPSLLRIVNSDDEFPLVIRSLRIILLLLNTQLSHLVIEGEIILSILNHLLLDNPNYTNIVLEIFRSCVSNFSTVELIYELYDLNPKKKHVIYELLTILTTYLQYNQIIKKDKMEIPLVNQVHLSSKLSTVKISILDLLDKSELPPTPDTYPIYLIFNILVAFTDGIAKFVHGLSNNNLENNLDFINNFIKLVYPLLESIFNYFLYSAMDNDSFHLLIRSLQKLTHTTGLLGLNSLRDGLLKLLATSIVSKTFNTRHVSCLRALINLAVSLGSTLKESWSIIWVALQWSDFSVNGPNEFSNYKQDFVSTLTSGEVKSISSSMNKFYESIEEYPIESYTNLLDGLMDLYTRLENQETIEDSTQEDLPLCTYNKIYFIDNLFEISKCNTKKFPETFKAVSDFFITKGVNNTNLNLRKYIIGKFNSIIKGLALGGINEEQDTFNQINELCLQGLNDLVTELNKNKSTELLILNNQFEIHQIILDTLTELLENYKNTNDQSWFIIFRIINNPFKFQDSDRITPLLNSSFNCLKIILNEFIVNLPVNIYKDLIDTLFNFCIQTIDLNILFSSISYFWLIADSIKKLQEIDAVSAGLKDISTETEFIQNIADKTDFKCLDVYLLLNLIKLSRDPRDQVRDGSIQTFFEIIDIHGQSFNTMDWELIYNIILSKVFEVNTQEETVKLKLEGMINIFNKFGSHFKLGVWLSFTSYMRELINLNQLKINIIVLQKFNDLLKITVDDEVVLLFFNFWTDYPIDYNFIDPELFIDTLVVLNKNFPAIHRKLKGITEPDLNKILNISTKCVTFPIIMRQDDKQPTELQKLVFENIRLIDLNHNDLINCILIRELSNFLVYQFKVREKIESKLTNLKLKYKLPTFISISNLSFELLQQVFDKIDDFRSLIDSNIIPRLMSSLLTIIEYKSVGNNEEKPLWKDCNQFLILLTSNLVKYEINLEVWELILNSINLCYKNNEQEISNIEQFHELTKIVLPGMKEESIIKEFLSELYVNSYLYEMNEIEQELISDDLAQSTKNLINYSFTDSFGTTAPVKFYKLNKMKMICLEQLIAFTFKNDSFQKHAIEYFMLRLAFTLRRLIEQKNLNYKCPILKIQTREITMMLVGLLEFLKGNVLPSIDRGVIILLVKVIGISSKTDNVIEQILVQLNNL